ncbi:trehalose utilization-domain-containing protein [Filobasidium floriforme]|uniref:trehalose utilization-domain-containing protein n=1 Tax=Filobasidium floriforme TaxID=5210 RepID=UPI001E8E6D1A|nr:trehalose utilization-domain-containing protein [Filobasidium floriforme]KAH8090552.1 trehalose utilization-domain-containing protein [Filobasidium floriforme]
MFVTITVLLSIATSIVMAQPRVLVFTATTGYRHDSIPDSISALQARSGTDGVDFEFTEDPTRFNGDELGRFDGVMFLSTTGEGVLDSSQAQAFHTYLQNGGNFVGVHAATDCLGGEDWYVQTIGTRFDYHPELQPATFTPLNKTHPSMVGVPDRWTFTEEVYNYRSDPRDVGAQVVLTVDESSYTGSSGSSGNYDQGVPHPIAWYITDSLGAQPPTDGAPGTGRSFYTSLGHLSETWQDPTFMGHVMGGLKWALESGTTRWTNGTALVGAVQPQNSSTSASSSAASTMGTSTASGQASTSVSGTGMATSTSASAGPTSSTPANSGIKDGSAVGKTAALAGAIAGIVGLML